MSEVLKLMADSASFGPNPVQTSLDTALADQWLKKRVRLAFGYTTAGRFMDLYSQCRGGN